MPYPCFHGMPLSKKECNAYNGSMKDFASFDGNDGSEEWLKEAQEFASAYAGRSDADIMKAIYARAVEGRRNGTLTDEQIDAFYARFAPMLDEAKRRRLQKVIEQLKRM